MAVPEQRGVLGESRSAVSAAWIAPPKAPAWLVIGHGAGAGMDHPFLVGFCRAMAGGVPVFAGGKSLGGRIASMCVADGMAAAGLVFLGYPLHPPGKPERLRADHLARIRVPMLFLQGTADPFAKPELIRHVVKGLGKRARLETIEGGDHSFNVRGRKADPREVGAGLAAPASAFIRGVVGTA